MVWGPMSNEQRSEKLPFGELIRCMELYVKSTIHETDSENKMGHTDELKKMGANIEPVNPEINDKESFYNFNAEDDNPTYIHAVKIFGPTLLHNAILKMENIRAGATMVLA